MFSLNMMPKNSAHTFWHQKAAHYNFFPDVVKKMKYTIVVQCIFLEILAVLFSIDVLLECSAQNSGTLSAHAHRLHCKNIFMVGWSEKLSTVFFWCATTFLNLCTQNISKMLEDAALKETRVQPSFLAAHLFLVTFKFMTTGEIIPN